MKEKYIGPVIVNSCSAWEEILHLGVRRDINANVMLQKPGESVEYLYYLYTGEILVSVFHLGEMENDIFILRDKSMLGLIGMFSPVRPKGVWLTLKPCTLYAFSKKTVYEHVPRHLLLNLLEQFSLLAGSLARRVSTSTLKCHEVRLAQLLLHLIDACKATPGGTGKVKVIPDITQEMAGQLLGMHPVTLSRLLAQFRNLGIVGKFYKKHLEILDIPGLHQIALGRTPILARHKKVNKLI